MEQAAPEVLPIKPGIVLDLLDVKAPALSATSDMPVIETRPDSSPPETEAKEAAPEPEEAEAEPTAETATAATDEQPGADPEVKKTPKGVQKRLDELTRQREDAERRADAERQEKLRLLAMLEGRQEQPKPAETPAPVVEEAAPVRPNRADYVDDVTYFDAVDTYTEAKAEFVAKREIRRQQEEFHRSQQEQAIAEGQRLAREAYLGRVAKTQEQYADFKEVAESPDVNVSIPMAHAIVHHEQGPAIQYYLGKNPAEAARIAKLDVPSQLVELGVIVASKLGTPAVATPAPTPKPAVSAAPKPINPTKPAETVVVKDPSLMTMEEYAAWRKKGRA